MSHDDEFTDFVAARWPRLVRSALLLGCTEPEAEDVVQTALARCYVHWRKVSRADNPDAYVQRVLVNTFVSSRRPRWRTERPTDQLPERAVADGTHAVDTADVVMRGLARLPQDQRVAVVMRHYAHMSEAQMVAALGVPAGTVKSRLSRAMNALAADPELAAMEGIA